MKILLFAITLGIGFAVVSFFGGHHHDNLGLAITPTHLLGTKSVKQHRYGTTADGKQIDEFICENDNGLVLKMITYGATVTSLEVPDRDGEMVNITLSCPDIQGYEKCTSYFGSSVGRFCNRIAKGEFSIDGKKYSLATNNEPNHLHGGIKGFDKVVWSARPIDDDRGVGVSFTYNSKDGEEGYPGNLRVTAVYLLTNHNELIVRFDAETDQPTHVNLTNHNYWNLGGAGSGDVLQHVLQVEADQYLEADETLIPTGKLLNTKGSPLDFTQPAPMGKQLDRVGGDPRGYDHCLVLRANAPVEEFDHAPARLRRAAIVTDPKSGRTMEIYTSQPGLQFYTGNFLDGSEGSGGFAQHGAFCLETQHYPDTPNHPEFPSTLLKPGEKYSHTTVHRFSVR